jgi:ATP-binding cassette, subfamily B, bacterial
VRQPERRGDTPRVVPAEAIPFLIHFLRPHCSLAAGVLGVIISGALCGVLAQFGLKMLVDGMARLKPDPERIAVYLGIFLGLLALENVFWRFGGWLGSRAVIRLGAEIRLDLLEALEARPWRFFNKQASSALAGRVIAASSAATAVLSTLVWNIIPPCADLVGSVVILIAIDWRLAIGLVTSTAAVTLGLRRLGLRGFPLHRAYHRQAAEVTGDIGDVLSNIVLVKGFNARARERSRLGGLLAAERQKHSRSWMFLEKMRCLHDISFWVITSTLLIAAVRSWSRGAISTGDVVVACTLSLRVLNGSRELALSLLGLSQQLGAISEAVEVLTAPEKAAPPACRPAIRVQSGSIAFRDVCYAPEGARMLFRNLDLNIPAGQRLGIVGPSGAGKSTLLRLVQGLDGPQRGTILLDGQRIDAVSPESLAEAFAVVTQEVALFHRTVRENLCYGRLHASADEIERVARAAGCDEFIRGLPRGYDTVVGERGVRLSGGQRQRIAIARALLKSAPVLLLDEATSALDSRSEQQMQAGVLALSRGRTVLAVAHRLSTIIDFDRVVVLQDGQILEDGPPGELSRGSGLFAAMWQLQKRTSMMPDLEAAADPSIAVAL